MKKIFVLFGALLFLISGVCLADKPKVEALKEGFYAQSVVSSRHHVYEYVVDSKSHLCFLRNSGTGDMVSISCKELANREEWKSIITWVSE